MKPKAEAKRKRKKEYQEPPEDAKLFVGNLLYDVDSEGLTQLFQLAGVVKIVEIDRSHEFGFVMMRTVEEAEKAVVLYNRYGVLTETTAELVTSFFLAATRRIVEQMRFVGNLLKGQTIGVIGAGRIGPAHARMMFLKVNGKQLVTWKRASFMEEVLREAGVIILHPVLDKTTYHLVNKERLAMMKKKVILVNCSRGPVIDEVALVEHLRENPMFRISLDVFEAIIIVICSFWLSHSLVMNILKANARNTGPEDVQVKVLYCGLCHSDLHQDEPYRKPGLADMKNIVVVPHTTFASKGKIKGYPIWSNPNIVEAFLDENSPPPIACPSIVNSKALDVVHFRDYTSLSSNNKYLLIEADDDTILTRLLTETPIAGRYADSWPPLQNSLHMSDWTSEHDMGANRSDLYKIGGLPIGRLPYEEVVPKAKELTGNFRVAAMMEDKQTFSLAVPVLSSIYNGLNRVYKSSQLKQLRISFPIHYVYGWLANYFKTHFQLSNGPSIPLMTTSSGEGEAKYFDGELARKCIHQGDTAIWNSTMPNKSSPCYFVDDDKNEESEISYFISLHFNLLPFRYGDESESSHGDRCWKKVKPSLAKKGSSNPHVEIHASSLKTPPTIEKVWPDNVQILEDPHQSKPQDSSESVVGPDSRELLLSSKKITSNSYGKVEENVDSNLSRQPAVTMSIFYIKKVISELKKEFIIKAWASIRTKLAGLTLNRDFSIQDDVEVILNDMSGMGADISPLQDLLESFFGMVTFYDQAQSALVDKTTIIKESEPYLKAKEHLDLVSKERDEKSEKVSAACKSFEKARKKVKKLKARQDAAKQEAAEMESKVLAAEEEFSKCSDVSLATTKASKVVEKKNQVLEAALQDLVNYKLYLN
ncbi:Glycerate dehydrogenase HPR, peroxisomal [Capsicum chinense]|nr:Glycerate dehydrogenase HPR, peroxisomal [Capsicum chinense]